MAVSVDLGASGAGEVLLSHVSARAVEAVCLLMIDSLDLETLMKVIPSVSTTVPFASRARMNETAWLSVLKAAGSELRPRTRTNAITLRYQFGSGQNDGYGDRGLFHLRSVTGRSVTDGRHDRQ